MRMKKKMLENWVERLCAVEQDIARLEKLLCESGLIERFPVYPARRTTHITRTNVVDLRTDLEKVKEYLIIKRERTEATDRYVFDDGEEAHKRYLMRTGKKRDIRG